MPMDLNDGIDLSTLAAPTTPPGTHDCTVPDGCGFLLSANLAPHNTINDCLATSMEYVEMYTEAENVCITLQRAQAQLADLFEQLRIANRALITANTQLVEEKDRYAGELRELRKKNPADQRAALLAAAGDLVDAVKKEKEKP